MRTWIDIRNEADQLSEEDRAGLASHLLASLSTAPLGPSDTDADERDREMDSGAVSPLSHEQFVSEVGRR